MEASTQVPYPVGMGWCMDHDELTVVKGCRLLCSHGTSVLQLQKGMYTGQLYLHTERSIVHRFVQAELCTNQAPEDEDDAEDFYNDDSDEDESDSETDESF